MDITFAVMQRIKARYFIEFFAHMLFWLMMYYALQGLTDSSFALIYPTAGRNALRLTGHRIFPYAGVVLGFLMLLFYSCVFWLFKKFSRYKSNYARALLLAGWLLLIYSSNYLVVRMLLGTHYDFLVIMQDRPAPPIPPSPGDFAALFSESWSQMQVIISFAFLAIMGIAAAYFFIKESIRNELARSKVEALQVNTELRFLRSQVNPHFLFNTLNNLFSMALKEGKSSLAEKIAKLSNMMRYMLYESNTDKVPLEKEVGCLKDYILLHSMRYASDEVEISFQYPEPAFMETVQVAPMLFIPFLENAFKHGVAVGEQSYIAMTIAIGPQKLVFSCENTDHSAIKKMEEENGGIGLENVKRRLKLLYPGRYELKAGSQNGNYMVNLQIDLL
jgi:hypothetical protein